MKIVFWIFLFLVGFSSAKLFDESENIELIEEYKVLQEKLENYDRAGFFFFYAEEGENSKKMAPLLEHMAEKLKGKKT